MSELRALVAAARQLREARQAFLSASVIGVCGSGYRHPGARMIASEERWVAGSISGGCLERDVVTKGFWHTRSAPVRRMTYDQTAEALEERTSSGCQGIIDVLLERHEPGHVDQADVFAAAERCLRDEQPAVVVTVIRSERADLPLGARLIWQAGRSYVEPAHQALSTLFADTARASQGHALERDQVEVLVEPMLPPIHLYIFGSGHDAAPLLALAQPLGWTVSVWDASPRSSARQMFQQANHYLTGTVDEAVGRAAQAGRAAAVVMGHHFPRDRAVLEALLASSVPYIGILGSGQRVDKLLEGTERCAGAARAQRVYAPVGLRLGAQTPAEIALAIIAEVQSVLTQ